MSWDRVYPNGKEKPLLQVNFTNISNIVTRQFAQVTRQLAKVTRQLAHVTRQSHQSRYSGEGWGRLGAGLD